MGLLKTALILTVSFISLNCEDVRERSRDIRNRNLRDNPEGSQVIRSLTVDSSYGKYVRGDYEGPTCEDASSEERGACEDKCKKMYGNEWRKCRDVPVSLIKEMDNNYNKVKRLQWLRDGRDSFRQEVDSFLFGVMIDIEVESVLTLLNSWRTRNSQNKGGVAQFLIWVAETPSISRAILKHDEEFKIYSKAFEILGRLDLRDQRDLSPNSYIKAGLSIDLESYSRTFLGIASEPTRRGRDASQDRVSTRSLENVFAIEGFHLLLQQKICVGGNSKQCKQEVYCARDRVRRTLNRRTSCPGQSRRRNSFSTRYCYANRGAWRSFNYLITTSKIEDTRDFDPDEESHINSDVCKDICDDHSRCDRSSVS